MTTADLTRIQEMANTLTENLCPVILLQPGLKRPATDESGTWLTFDDPELVELAIQQFHGKTGRAPNLGVLLHPREDSHLLCIDIDGNNGGSSAKLQSLGVSQTEESWRQITGKRNGHFHVFYWWQGDELPRIANKPDGIDVDLLSNGYAVVAPSDTSLEPDGGGPYQWVAGHGPIEISVTELEPPPDPLIEWWLQRIGLNQKTTSPVESGAPESGKAWTLLNDPIPQGARNENLTRIAGWLRLYHPPHIVETLLLVINDARCNPPVEPNEVLGIARSVCRYPQKGVNGHPRAVVPTFSFAEEI